MMRPLLPALVLAMVLAGCSADPAPDPTGDDPRVSVAAEPDLPQPQAFATDLEITGWVLDAEATLPPVTTTGYSGTASGDLVEVLVQVSWVPASPFPLRVCLSEGDEVVAEIPCAEGMSPLTIAWDNATAGVPALPGGYRTVTYSSPQGPQTIARLTQHVEGVVIR